MRICSGEAPNSYSTKDVCSLKEQWFLSIKGRFGPIGHMHSGIVTDRLELPFLVE